jgi:hypothetical protein
MRHILSTSTPTTVTDRPTDSRRLDCVEQRIMLQARKLWLGCMSSLQH